MVRGLAVAVAALLILAGPAGAVTTNCGGFQAALNAVPATGGTVTLTEDCSGHFDLPSRGPDGFGTYPQITVEGAAGSGVVLTGDGSNRIFTGDDVARLLIQNLTFVGGQATGAGADGGAILITGDSSLQVFNSSFFGNSANDRGGAIEVAANFVANAGMNGVSLFGNTFGSTTTPSQGNGAATGGAVSVDSQGGGNKSFTDNLFANNVATAETVGNGNGGALSYTSSAVTENVHLTGNDFVQNVAAGNGGGAFVVNAGSLIVSSELYDRNRIGELDGGNDDPRAHLGGGLYVGNPGILDQHDNAFTGNTVQSFNHGQEYGGGGEAIIGSNLNAQSRQDRWIGNAVAGQPAASGFDSEGGGLYLSGNNTFFQAFLDVVAGNSVGALGEGGGIYTGAPLGIRLRLYETTVAGNSVGAGGQFGGIAGDNADRMFARNSIVYNGSGDIGGFGGFDLQYTDACNDGPTPFAGEGNICTDPLLVNPVGGNVHEMAASPTIDAGSDGFLHDGALGERPETDYEGDPRPTDGDGDGHTVDMGADESPAFVAQHPPPPHTPQCSDTVDNDGDGAIDGADPGCLAGPTDDNEGDETPGDLVLCGRRKISLVRADVKGSKVQLSGFVTTALAGQKITLSVRYLKKGGKAEKLGTVRAAPDGSFHGRVKKPKKRAFTLARYRARIGKAKSVELKLPQSLASSSLKRVGGNRLELRGRVDRKLLGKGNAVVVKRILCGRYRIVGQAKPSKNGKYAVRFPAPTTMTGSALYRAESKVLARPGSKRYVRQFARAIGITF
jgi:hypothetical protein